jgi:D-alanyl-D-alanine carboxypeptidase
MLREMTTPTPSSSLSDVMTAYGLGLTRYTTPCGLTAWGHGGSIGGYLSDVYATPDGGTVAVFLQNAVGATSLRESTMGELLCSTVKGK